MSESGDNERGENEEELPSESEDSQPDEIPEEEEFNPNEDPDEIPEEEDFNPNDENPEEVPDTSVY